MCSDKVFTDLLVTVGKLKWLGDFEFFQQFVEGVIDIKAKQTLPGNECKLIETNYVSICWYPSKPMGKKFKAKLSWLLCTSLDCKDKFQLRESTTMVINLV